MSTINTELVFNRHFKPQLGADDIEYYEVRIRDHRKSDCLFRIGETELGESER